MFKAWQIFLFSLIPLAIVFAGVISGAFRGVDSAREPTPTPVGGVSTGDDDGHAHDPATSLSYEAATGSRRIDGAAADWAGVPALDVTLESLDGARELSVNLQVSFDAANIYVLVSVPDDYNATPGEHEASGALAMLWAIDEEAGPHMGTDGVRLTTSLGMVDIWHWEIDCEPGVVSGGQDRSEDGDDPDCNLDDEYATTPFERNDDAGDNLLTGVYDHTGRASGEDAAGTWYWEISRPLATGDAQDAQFAAGGAAKLALAYWDPDQTADGWTDSGHLQSAEVGWIIVQVPASLP